MKTARFWQPAENGAVKCSLCPHRCRIAAGARSRCFGRVNRDGTLIAETWGRPVAMQVDPIEKKPLYHFLPGSRILSLGTLGCNLACMFCQNWSLSHPGLVRPSMGAPLVPEKVARLAGVPADVLARAGEILARLEAGEAGRGAKEALSDLPLFAAVPPPPAADALRARLADIHPDSLTPRAALDLLYELKGLADD